jgi:hypothetical protein
MKARITAALLIVIGSIHMAADIVGAERLEALANAAQASPAMKVFTSHEDYETFSPRFEIRYVSIGGEQRTLELTPSTYAGLAGPYNRRNAYGAALAYAPVLIEAPRTRAIVPTVLRYGFCDPGPLVAELGLADFDDESVSVVIVPRHEAGRDRMLRFEVNCDE